MAIACAVSMVGVAVPQGAESQVPASQPVIGPALPTAAGQRARVRRLAELHRNAAEAARLATLRATEGPDLDTVRIGSMVLLAEPSLVPLAQRAAEQAWSIVDAGYGTAAGQIVHPAVVLRGAHARDGLGRSSEPRMSVSVNGSVRSLAGIDAQELESRLLVTSGKAMSDAMDPLLRSWIGTYRVTDRAGALVAQAYEDLATSRSVLARACLLGEIDACRKALVLTDSYDPVTHWYDAPRRRELARERRSRLRAANVAEYEDCLAGDDDACVSTLGRLGPRDLPAPLSTSARHSLVRIALEHGGRDAFARLFASGSASGGASMDARLSAAAGIGSDSLLAEWRARIMAAQPVRAGLPPSNAAAGLFWVAFLGFLATRSSRWR